MSNDMQIPESLAGQLREFERRLLRMETLVAVFGGLCGFLLTYGILFLSDRLGNTPGWERVVLTLSGGTACAGFCWSWLHHWWWRRRDTRELAKLVQKQYGRLGDRLLGAVELAEGTATGDHMSPALCRAAIRQVADESARYDFKGAVATRRPRIVAIAFAALVLLVVVPFALFPQAGWNALIRWGKPFSNVERYTFVSVEAMPAEMVVPHGEEFEIGCVLTPHSLWHPVRATCRFGKQPPIESRVQNGKAWFRLPGLTRNATLTVRMGDLVKDILVKPAFRPELVRLTARVSLPEYLGHSPVSAPIESGRAEFLAGSRVRLTGTVSRSLKSASVKRDAECPVPVHSNEFVLADVDAGTLSNGCVFTWIDTCGLSGVGPYVLNTTVVEDEAPRVECRGVDRAIAILQDEVVPFDIRSEDDYGIQEMWVNWNSTGGKEKDTPALTGTRPIGKGGRDRQELEGSFSFSPIACHIPEETAVVLCAYATDYCPGRKPSVSAVHRIYVLSRAKHAKLIQELMEALHARLEDRAREEERLLEKNRELAKLSPEQLAEDSRAAELKDGQAGEQDNAEQTAQLSKEARELIKEALRNKEISEAVLREWAELAQTLSDLSATEMKEATKALGQAAANASQRPGKLGDAVKLEELILLALQGMERKSNRSIEDMLARGFVNRLLLVAAMEKETGKGLKDILPGIVGIAPADLPADKKKQMDLLTQRQEGACKEAGYIQDDLLGFFNRTRAERYGRVFKDMADKGTKEKLKGVADRIRANIAMEAIGETADWTKQFVAWAEMLKKKGAGGGGEGGEGQDPEAEDIEVMIGLMRARQREESLRDQTRLAEESRLTNEQYLADAEKLGALQDEITGDVRALEGKGTSSELRRLVEVVSGEMMNAAVFLRRPQTDAATVAIETTIIELLSNDASSGDGSGRNGMAMKMMMGMGKKGGRGSGAGKKGGGSTAGGTTDKSNVATGAGGAGEAPEARNVDKAGGTVGAEWPEEFKEALEGYFKALEEEK